MALLTLLQAPASYLIPDKEYDQTYRHECDYNGIDMSIEIILTDN